MERQLSMFPVTRKRLFEVVLEHVDPFVNYVLGRNGEKHKTVYTWAHSKARAARNAVVRNPGHRVVDVREA